MIDLINVTRFHGPTNAPSFLLNDVSLRISPMERIGILAHSGAGKSTFARIISGVEKPDIGFVDRRCNLSWPIGFSSAFHPNLSPNSNIKLIAKLRNLDPDELALSVEDFSELGAAFYKPTSSLAPGKRVQLALALSLNTEFDMYLADDMSASTNPAFREKCDAALLDKLKSSGLIMFTRHPRTLDHFANRYFVLFDASLIECGTTEEASDILKITSNEDLSHHAVA